MLCVKRLGNTSKRYDGKNNLEYISKIIWEEDAAGPLVVKEAVKICWTSCGKAKLWKAANASVRKHKVAKCK